MREQESFAFYLDGKTAQGTGKMRDIQRDILGDKNRDKRDIFEFAHVPLPGHSGHPPFRGVSVVPVDGGCPAEMSRFRTRRDRAQAHDRWMAAGMPWPPEAGLVSAMLSQVMARGSRGRRY